MTRPLSPEEKDARAVARQWRKRHGFNGNDLYLVVTEAQYHLPEQPNEKIARDVLEALAGEVGVTLRRPYHPFWKRVRELVEAP
jgi:hypothetical protein